nr:kelch-like protein 2 [Lytechinus pictus]
MAEGETLCKNLECDPDVEDMGDGSLPDNEPSNLNDIQVTDLEETHQNTITLHQQNVCNSSKDTGGLRTEELTCKEEDIQIKKYQYPHKSSELLGELNDFRLAGKLVDVTLVSSDEREFPCHRAVLAASSPYFGAMFTDDLQESRSDRIELTNIKGTALDSIINAVYRCKVNISSDLVQDLLATAHFLNYPDIIQSCCQFLEDSLTPQNCLGIIQLAETYLCDDLWTQAWNYALTNFRNVSSCKEFLQSKALVLERLVSSNELNVLKEDEVLAAVLQWALSDQMHIDSLPSVLAKVRLPLVSNEYLTQTMNSYQFLHGNGKCLSLIRDAQNLKELARNQSRRDHPLLKPRNSMRTEVLVVVGGMVDNREWITNVSCFNPKANQWSPMANLPFDHSDYAAASIDDAIYVSGGFHRTKGNISEVWRYDEVHDRWSRVQDLILPRFNHTSIGHDHHIYVLGGEDADSSLTEIERYSPALDKWDIIGSVSPTGSGMAVVAIGQKLYIIGWLTNVRLMCVVQCFDLETAECSTIPSSGLNRQLFPAVALNDSIFILGGNRMKEVAIYDPETFISTKAESMKFKRNTPSATVVGGKIYVTGGELRQHVAKVEAYDPDLDLWDTLEPMPHAVCFHGCAMIKRYLGPPYYP